MRKQRRRSAVTAKLISTFVFATRMVQSFYFINPKFQASSHLGLNSIYLIMNIHVDIHTMLCETGSGSKHKAYIEAISCNSVFNTIFK